MRILRRNLDSSSAVKCLWRDAAAVSLHSHTAYSRENMDFVPRKAGGRLLGFNLDPKFSDVLDALIVADLRTAPAALLERCMGRAEAQAFLGKVADLRRVASPAARSL